MPRTPLFRFLRRSLDLARVANATGRPSDEIVGLERALPRWTRRELVRSSALAGAGLALGCS
ncbi:MAG: hypothetical protein F9K18_15385, partial [Thermoanaerobaculia bacterium]